MGKARPVTFQGIYYSSMTECVSAYASRWNVCYGTASHNVRELMGFSAVQKTNKGHPVMVDGKAYSSVKEAAKALSKERGTTVPSSYKLIRNRILRSVSGYAYL